jgi:hypothetical protein
MCEAQVTSTSKNGYTGRALYLILQQSGMDLIIIGRFDSLALILSNSEHVFLPPVLLCESVRLKIDLSHFTRISPTFSLSESAFQKLKAHRITAIRIKYNGFPIEKNLDETIGERLQQMFRCVE